jgi:hypothetical protein
METKNGSQWSPENMVFDMNEIAWALSMQCRYNGHVKEFYSVAEHSVLMTEYAHGELNILDTRVLRTILLHDAAEAYIGDMVSPIKCRFPGFSELEDVVMGMIAHKYQCEFPFPPVVKDLDTRILLDEREELFDSVLDWGMGETQPLGIDIWCVDQRQAYNQFMNIWERISP